MEKISLYLGSSPETFKPSKKLLHLPLTEVVERDFDSFSIRTIFDDINDFTHIVFASKNSVKATFDALAHFGYSPEILSKKICIAVGKNVAEKLLSLSVKPAVIIEDVTQEGIAHVLEMMDLEKAYVLITCSSRCRPYLKHILMFKDVRHQFCTLYDVLCKKVSTPPNLETVEEIIFTSPATVEAFIETYGLIPRDKKIVCSGPITKISLALSVNRSLC